MDVLDKISSLAQGIAEARGLELVDVEMQGTGRRRMLRVFIGKPAGVSVDDCTQVSREMAAVLDAENWLGDDSYTLEVSSPGLDRPFKTPADWRRNLGRDVRVVCRDPVEGKLQFQGRLLSADEQEAVIESAGRRVRIPLRNVASAKVEIRFA